MTPHRSNSKVPADRLLSTLPQPPRCTLFPYTTLFRSPSTGPGRGCALPRRRPARRASSRRGWCPPAPRRCPACRPSTRSEEHTSELQSRENLVCRLLLEKKKKNKQATESHRRAYGVKT